MEQSEFPKEIYVQRYKTEPEESVEDQLYNTFSSRDEVVDADLGYNIAGDYVAIYELKKIVRIERNIKVSFKEKDID